MKISVSSYSFSQYIRAGKLTQLTAIDKAKEMGMDDISDIKDAVKKEIQELNKKLPIFKQIRGIEIRKTEFEKTTTKKIKRIKGE